VALAPTLSETEEEAISAPPPLAPSGGWSSQWLNRTGLRRRWFRPNRFVLVLAFLFVALMIGWAVAPQLFTGGSPSATNPIYALAGLSARFPLGADQYGRSVYTGLVYGARGALEIGFLCTLFAGVIGSTMGVVSGYFGGKVDMIIMRFIDMLMALPALLLALIFMAALAPTLTNEIIAVSVATVPGFARVMRGRALEVRSRLFIAALTVVGVRKRRILFRHVIPSCASPALVLAAINVGTAIVIAASLSFLGLGPSGLASWGTLISNGQGYINKEWWISTFPGIVITLLVIAVNIIGDWTRDVMEPVSR
jgi:peptide/nickel transport system permease protein